ncbi:MAG: glycosyltransferase, partial [Azoarcus sp.]|jgi:hypothetical protein|nr:glycosyltransferase [Azoarcus sp.]
LLQSVIGDLARFADVTLLGSGDFGQPFDGLPGVNVVCEYEIDELAGLVVAMRPDCALMLSVLPESYSYTLSEMMALGVPVVATRMGAFMERIEDGENGFLVSADAAAVISRLRELDADRVALERVATTLRKRAVRTAFDMVKDYHGLLRMESDASSSRSGEGLLQVLFERTQLEDSLAAEKVKAARFEADVHAHSALVKNREGRIAELEARIAELEADVAGLARARVEYEAVLASTSWRVTRPLRSISGLLSGAFKSSSAVGCPVVEGCAVGAAPLRQEDVSAGPEDPASGGEHRESTEEFNVSAPLPGCEANAFPACSIAACRRLVRERLGLPDCAFVTAAAGSVEAFKRFVKLAGSVSKCNTHVAFVWLGSWPAVDAGCRLEADILVETRDLFLPDDINTIDWVPGADIYLLTDTDNDAYRQSALEAGVRVLPADSLEADAGAMLEVFRIGT